MATWKKHRKAKNFSVLIELDRSDQVLVLSCRSHAKLDTGRPSIERNWRRRTIFWMILGGALFLYSVCVYLCFRLWCVCGCLMWAWWVTLCFLRVCVCVLLYLCLDLWCVCVCFMWRWCGWLSDSLTHGSCCNRLLQPATTPFLERRPWWPRPSIWWRWFWWWWWSRWWWSWCWWWWLPLLFQGMMWWLIKTLHRIFDMTMNYDNLLNWPQIVSHF